MRSPSILLSLLVSLPCTACLDQLVDEPQTEQSEAFVPAQPLPLEGSATAYGMLRVVNERSFLELDEVLGLDRRAAQSIMSYRAGEDRYPGTDEGAGYPVMRYTEGLEMGYRWYQGRQA